MSSNEFYGELNARFDERASFLRDKGYKYETIPVIKIAVFTKNRYGKVHTIAAGCVLNACERVWADTIPTLI